MNPDALLETLEDIGPRPPVMREVSAGETPASTTSTGDPELQLQLVAPSGTPVRRESRPRPATPIDPNGDDAILTAKELATAFQLGVGPQATRRRHRRQFVRTALALLFLVLVGTAIWAYNQPQIRSQAAGYFGRAVAWFRETSKPAPAGLDDELPLSPSPAAKDVASDTPTGTDRRPTPAIVDRMPDPEPTPRPSPIPTPPQPGPVPSGNTPTSIAAIDPALANLPPIEQSRTLYRRAIDAMAREDFATALRLLEAIETLPRNVHPGDLPSRLAIVRQKLAGQ